MQNPNHFQLRLALCASDPTLGRLCKGVALWLGQCTTGLLIAPPWFHNTIQTDSTWVFLLYLIWLLSFGSFENEIILLWWHYTNSKGAPKLVEPHWSLEEVKFNVTSTTWQIILTWARIKGLYRWVFLWYRWYDARGISRGRWGNEEFWRQRSANISGIYYMSHGTSQLKGPHGLPMKADDRCSSNYC